MRLNIALAKIYKTHRLSLGAKSCRRRYLREATLENNLGTTSKGAMLCGQPDRRPEPVERDLKVYTRERT